jgi:phage-related minor tail protein
MEDDSDSGLTGDMGRMSAQMQDMTRSAGEFSRLMSTGLKAALVDGKALDSVMKQMVLSLSSRVLGQALKPLDTLVGSMAGGLFGTDGLSSLISGGVTAFADGGVVAQPTFFGHSGGLGLMGEAGAEAILPLARGADGRLGVAMSGAMSGGGAGPGAGNAPVVVNVTTRDAESFRRSEAQVSALVARAVGRGRRGL